MRRASAGAAALLLVVTALALGRHGGAWLLGTPLPPAARIPLVVVLLLLANGLAGHRLLALWLTLALIAADAAITPSHWQRLIVPIAVALVLVVGRGNYVARPDPRRLKAASVLLAAALVVALGRGLWAPSWHETPFSTVIAVVAVAGLGVAMAAAPAPPPSDDTARAWVRELVQDPSAGSLAPFATRADRTYVFTPGGDSAIGYRVRFGVALAGGDPIGPDPAAAIDAFVAMCARSGWRPAVLGADARATGDLWRRAGVRHAVEIGDEAVLDVDTFSLASRAMRNVRQAARRATNAGVTVEVGALDPALVPRLHEVLHDWLRGRRERGFAMNLDAILTPRAETVYAVARDAAGEPVAFARFPVAAGGRILSLDVAPRRRDAPNGVVERMIVAVVDYARDSGAAEVTLNFAGMRSVYGGHTRGARALQIPLHALDRWIELRSLYLFTGKFHPRWRPRQLRFRSWWELIPVAAAALTAEFGAQPAAPARYSVP